MELVEQLKHVYSYNEIYELLYDGPVSFDDAGLSQARVNGAFLHYGNQRR